DGDGESVAGWGGVVNLLVFAGQEGNALYHLADILGYMQLQAVAMRPRLLLGDADAFFHCTGIVRANLGTDAVFKRRDDLAAGGIVFGIRTEDKRDVEGQP